MAVKKAAEEKATAKKPAAKKVAEDVAVAVATAEKDNLEEEEVLASVTVGEGEEPAAGDPEAEEAKKKEAAVEEARNAIKARLQR